MLKWIAGVCLLLILGGLAAFLVSSSRGESSVTDEAFRDAAQAAASGALLTAEDFPTGWRSEPLDPVEEDDDNGEIPEGLSPECRKLFESFDQVEEGDAQKGVASATSDYFSNDDGEGVSVEVEVFRTLYQASKGEESLDPAFGTCGDDLATVVEDELNRGAQDNTESPRIVRLVVSDPSVRDLGDWSRDLGLSITYEFEGQRLDTAFVITFVRVGRTAGTFTHYSVAGTFAPLIDSLRERFAERLTQAEASLPQ